MSYSIYGNEIHRIHNINDDTKVEVSKLIDYIQQFNHMNDLWRMNIKKIRLAVDNKETQIENLRIELPGKDYYMIDKGDPHAADAQWDESSELISLLGTAEEANNIEFEINYDLVLAELIDARQYGVMYWDVGKNIPDSILSNAEHKIIEYHDTYEYLYMFVQDGSGRRMMVVPYDDEPIFTSDVSFYSSKESCRDIKNWYCFNFTIDMQVEDTWDDIPEQRDEIMSMVRSFAQKYEFAFKIDDPFEEQLLMFSPLCISNNNVDEFVKDVQVLLDFACEQDAWIHFKATFTASDSYPFAAMKLVPSENEYKIETHYYRF